TPNAVRNAPTGQQCSGTTLNFSVAPTGGNGTYTYAWNVRTNGTGTYGSGTGFASNTSASPSSGSGAAFSTTPINNTTSATLFYVEVAVTSNGQTCTHVFSPTINPVPAAPVVSSITQPTCLAATGSVHLSGLPSSGSWTVTGNPSGSGTTATVSGLSPGTYTFIVTNSFNCPSAPSGNAVIDVAPIAPTTPTIVSNYNCTN